MPRPRLQSTFRSRLPSVLKANPVAFVPSPFRIVNFFLKIRATTPFSKIGREWGRESGRERVRRPAAARCTPWAALTRSASHAASPRPCAQHHSACAGPRRCAALLVAILSQRGKAFAGRHCEGRGSAERPRLRTALPASAGAYRGACLPRASCPFAPAARACASR